MLPRPRAILVLTLVGATLGAGIACGGTEAGDTGRTAGIIHRLLLAAGTEGSQTLESFPGALPGDLPAQPPLYPDADLIVSNRQPSPSTDADSASGGVPQPLLYFIVLDTPDSREDVYAYYEEALDADPWQLQSSFSTEQLDTLQFFNVEDGDLSGVVSIAHGGEDERTGILISLQDAGAFADEEPPYVLQPSLPLPGALPPDVPLFAGATVTGSAFFREPGLQSFLVIFLTTASQDDVIGFYREAFQANGWTVQDTAAFGLEGRIDFRDEAGDIQGDVFADRFGRDRQYTEVTVQVQVNPARESSQPRDADGTAEPTPEPTEAAVGTATPAR